jgi:hypothetical protein
LSGISPKDLEIQLLSKIVAIIGKGRYFWLRDVRLFFPGTTGTAPEEKRTIYFPPLAFPFFLLRGW